MLIRSLTVCSAIPKTQSCVLLELGDGFNIYSLIVCNAIPATQSGVLQVGSTTTCCPETTQARWDPQSKGFLPRKIVDCEDIPFKYRIGSSKCVIEFSDKSNNLILGNAFIIPASIEAMLLPLSHRIVNLSYTVSFSRHLPSTSAIRFDENAKFFICGARSFTEGMDASEFQLAAKVSKDKKPWK